MFNLHSTAMFPFQVTDLCRNTANGRRGNSGDDDDIFQEMLFRLILHHLSSIHVHTPQ